MKYRLAALAAAALLGLSLTGTASAAPQQATAPRGEIVGYQYQGELVLSGTIPYTCLTALKNDTVVAAECGRGPEDSHQDWNLYYKLGQNTLYGSIALLKVHQAAYLSQKLGTDQVVVFDTAVIVSFDNLTKQHWLIRNLAGQALSGEFAQYPFTVPATWSRWKTRGKIQTWTPAGGEWTPLELDPGR